MFIAFETLIKRPRWQSVVLSMFVGTHFPEINERYSFKKLENLWTMVLYIQKVFFFPFTLMYLVLWLRNLIELIVIQYKLLFNKNDASLT